MNNLYHGTWEDNFKKIVIDGFISSNSDMEETTELLNSLIKKYHKNNENIRSGAVYLSKDNESTEIYDFAFKIPLANLNLNLLYVADNREMDNLLSAYNSGKSKEILSEIVQRYIESFVNFETYIKKEEEYNNLYFPEFLYFNDIDVRDYLTDEDYEIAYNEED